MSEFSQIRARVVSVDGAKIVALRQARNWSQEDLALQIRMDPKTIQSMEAGQPKYKSTISRVAKALGVEEPEDLIIRHSPPQTAPAPGTPTKGPKTVTLVFLLPRQAFDDAETITIVAKIARDAETTDDIIVDDIRIGSVSIFVEMTDDDATRVLNAFITSKLAAHGIESISIALYAFDQPVTEEIIGDVAIIRFTKRHAFGDDSTKTRHFVDFVLAQPWTKIILDCANLASSSTGALLYFSILSKKAKASGRKVLCCNVADGILVGFP